MPKAAASAPSTTIAAATTRRSTRPSAGARRENRPVGRFAAGTGFDTESEAITRPFVETFPSGERVRTGPGSVAEVAPPREHHRGPRGLDRGGHVLVALRAARPAEREHAG